MSWSEVKKINSDNEKSLDVLIKEQFSNKITPIDSKLTTTQTKVNSIETKVNSLESKVNNLESDLTSLINRVGIKSFQVVAGDLRGGYRTTVNINPVNLDKCLFYIDSRSVYTGKIMDFIVEQSFGKSLNLRNPNSNAAVTYRINIIEFY